MEKTFNSFNKHMINKTTSWEKVKDFYQLVIEDFGKRLSIRFAGRQQGFDVQIIDQMKKKLRQQIQRPSELFLAALQTKHSNNTTLITDGTKQDDIVKQEQNEPRHKNQEQQQDYLLLFNQNDKGDGPEPFIKKQEMSPQEHEHNSQKKPQSKKIQVKIEQKYNEQQNIHDIDEDRDDEQEREKKRITEILKSNLQMHIVGTYQPKSKKHIAKDESIKLELDDVLIKYRDPSLGQTYCHKLICEFKKD